ncbi:MAG TPA: FtsW/RodA/SpoVE family cell cycle protein [Bryobacteraceae bacterium]|nr:FtsW/RodA/SpoVE family cell cycle protein [Bryobacteraceae bacterium]
MAITRSKAVERAEIRRLPSQRAGWRVRELGWMLVVGLAVVVGLVLVYRAKSPDLSEIEKGLASKKLLNLNELSAREDLLPALGNIANQADRVDDAGKIYALSGGLPNVGHIRGLMTGDQFRELKPQFVVRRPGQFRRAFFLWSGLFLVGFLLAHVWWSVRGFRGDQTLLPAVLLLSGIGLTLMISLRDPVRDNLLFVDFAQGVVCGCVLLAGLSGLNFERLFGKLSFVPLLGSCALSVLLILFGRGPGTSDAKVNLFGFQPVELIRILLIFFLAGYFARRWDILRHAHETRASLARLTRRFDIPPVEYTLPALVSVALSLAFFFLQKDMGPALVFACLFLVLYGMARRSALVPVAGLVLMGGGLLFGYVVGVPHTVRERVSMWLSPWNNLVHGGDQLAHSLWAFATGGLSGMGIGRGDPQMVPAAHTDLILSALGEELGFLGVAVVFGLFAWIVYRAFRIAGRARTDYEFFLAAGMAAATALQILLISGGALGVTPLSGVVTPFLSYGRTSMIANFVVIAILMSISARSETKAPAQPIVRVPLGVFGAIFGIAGALVVAKAGYTQVLHSSAIMGAGTLVTQADGARRYQYNPRLLEVMRDIPKGTIFDRNGLPLATSNWDELEKHRAEYQQLGIDIDRACPRTESRHYPFGGLMFDLLGDLRTRTRWAATNTSYVERDSARRLRGYDDRPTLEEVENPKTGKIERVIRYDYRELVPLLRYRYEPQNPAVRRVLDRPRDVRMSIDARLEVRVSEILRNQLKQAKQDKGAAVVMDPSTGDLLAAVSYPLPPDAQETAEQPAAAEHEGAAANPYLDRARYGLYPPGSTFKVVTAMAALRKDPALAHRTYECIRLPDGRVGNFMKGSTRPIRDDVQDSEPHGTLDMQRGIVVSCNAYFAQLGTYDVGAEPLWATANLLGIATASPNTAAQLKKSLPQSSYGQGQVVASPFQLARVASTVANGGAMPQGRWITDETNARTTVPEPVMTAAAAKTLGQFMREVVTQGTGRRAAASVPVAGKTGTAELADAPSHAWFIGFAPYGAGARKIALSVLVENGVYGGTAAAPAASEIVNAAVKLGLIQP